MVTGVDPDDFRLVAEVNDMQKSSTDKYHMLPVRKPVPGAFIFTRGDASGQAQPSPTPACWRDRASSLICCLSSFLQNNTDMSHVVLLNPSCVVCCFDSFLSFVIVRARFDGPGQASRDHHFPEYHGSRHSHTPRPPPTTV